MSQGFADRALEFISQRQRTAGLSDGELSSKAGYSKTMLRLWRYGTTASPRVDTVDALLRVFGYKLAIVKL